MPETEPLFNPAPEQEQPLPKTSEQSRVPEAKPNPPSAEISEEEQNEIAEVREQIQDAFGQLYDILPRQGLNNATIEKTINTNEQLRQLGPAVIESVVQTIQHESLQTKPKEEFIDTLLALERVQLWLFAQGLNQAGDKRLFRVRQEINDME